MPYGKPKPPKKPKPQVGMGAGTSFSYWASAGHYFILELSCWIVPRLLHLLSDNVPLRYVYHPT